MTLFAGGPSSVLCGVRDKSCVRTTEESFHVDKDGSKASCKCLDRCEYVQFQVKAKQSSG